MRVIEVNNLGINSENALGVNQIMDHWIFPVFIYDSLRKLQYTNFAGERIFGVPRQNLYGNSFEYIVKNSIENIYGFLRLSPELPENGRYLREDIWVKDPAVSDKPQLMERIVVPLEGGGWMAMYYDHPERFAERRKQLEVLGMLVHDLKNRLHATDSALEMLEDSVSDPQLMESLLLLAKASNRDAALMLSDLLDAIRSQEDRLKLAVESISLLNLFSSVKQTFLPSFLIKNISMDVRCNPSELACEGDQKLLSRALENLIHNAVRHTPGGGAIVIEAEEKDDLIKISIRNTGMGIRPEHLPYIFDCWVQSENGGSAGLGLSFVKKVTALHQGTIAVESTPGSETTFYIHLPRKLTAQQSHGETK